MTKPRGEKTKKQQTNLFLRGSSELKCSQPNDWPWAHLPQSVFYPNETGVFTDDDEWILNVPEFYRTPYGSCVGL